MAHGILSAFPPITVATTLHGLVAENWQGIGSMWRDASFAIFGFLLGVTMALWILILLAARWTLMLGSWIMTVLDALAILEAATLECKQRDIYTPEVKEALDLLQQRIWPEWLIPQFRYHARLNETNEIDLDKDAQQQALRAIFPCIRESVN
jgi:hypothetical protein